jgi:hypothetical protein
MKIMLMNGKRYLVKTITHRNGDDTFELVPFDEKEYNKVINGIVEAVKKSVDPAEAVKAGLGNLDWESIMKIYRAVKRKAKVRGEKGCYNIVVGSGKSKQYIPMVG